MAEQRKYVAFDIETAAVIPDWESARKSNRPLGISCAATLASDETNARLWYGRAADGSPAGQMRQDEAHNLLEHLAGVAKAGCPASWKTRFASSRMRM